MGTLGSDLVAGLRLRDLVDMAIVAFVFYRVFLMFKGTLALQMLTGLGFLVAARFAAREADLHSLNFILDNFWAFWVLAFVVLFQPELRRTLAEAGRNRLLWRLAGDGTAHRAHVVDEVVRAVESLAAKRIGALIALEGGAGLTGYAELGVAMDAVVSAELMGSLFQPGSPLHDGAVIIRGERITAAGCFLPLSRNLRLSRTLGTRHRAALGLSEETDAAVVVISEETGAVSLAVGGVMERPIAPARLRLRLLEVPGQGTAQRRDRGLLAEVRRLTTREKA